MSVPRRPARPSLALAVLALALAGCGTLRPGGQYSGVADAPFGAGRGGMDRAWGSSTPSGAVMYRDGGVIAPGVSAPPPGLFRSGSDQPLR